jgi:putative hydrolase of the HAD superfamily
VKPTQEAKILRLPQYNLERPTREVKSPMIETIAFDADDTLWQNETLYQDALAHLSQILSPWIPAEHVKRLLTETEMRNLPVYGYGIKAFTLSMIETALQVSQGKIGSGRVQQILALGRSMLAADVKLHPHVEETLQTLSRNHRLMVITKGDLLDQTNKLTRSGLEHFFSLVEVLNQKTPETYREILERHNLNIKTFLMVGNSLRSDIAPVLALGGKAVHIPTDSTWELELLADFDPHQGGFYKIEQIIALPALVENLKSINA